MHTTFTIILQNVQIEGAISVRFFMRHPVTPSLINLIVGTSIFIYKIKVSFLKCARFVHPEINMRMTIISIGMTKAWRIPSHFTCKSNGWLMFFKAVQNRRILKRQCLCFQSY